MAVIIDGDLGVDKIKNGTVTSDDLASTVALGVRNLIINGDMRIAQRGTSVTGITGDGLNTVDRFTRELSGAGTWTMTQDTSVPTGQGFANSMKYQCTTANASLGASAYFAVEQRIEGQNVQHFKYGTSNAENVTLSFWVKSNKTGTYILEFYQPDSGRQQSQSYTISSAGTWEKKTITIDGDTSGTINNDNGDGFRLNWWLAAGSDRTSGTLNTSWASSVTANRAVGQVNLADSTSNYINITGVQLEVGDTATPFEHRPYDMELARCQRYYQPVNAISGNASSTNGLSTNISFVVPMRATPTISVVSALKIYDGVTTYTQSSANAGSYLGNEYGGLWYSITNFSGLTQYRPYGLNTNANQNAVRASSEL
jgi:hypothetical protein